MSVRFFGENTYCVDIQGRKKWVSYLSNRTKERKNQNDLADALHMAQAANDAKSAFLSSVSHDIRTPMNAIIGFLALMRDEVDNPGDVLDMNKIESGSTTDGVAAIQMMRENREAGRPYDLILLDWKMPNLNGLETARLRTTRIKFPFSCSPLTIGAKLSRRLRRLA